MSIKSTFNDEKIKHLHRSKSAIVKVGTSLAETLDKMKNVKTGVALVVNEENQLTGIFTERDVLLKVLGKEVDLNTSIDTIMTSEPFHLGLEDSAANAVELMVKHKVRHIPLVDTENLVEGQIDILNIVNFLVENFPNETYNLPPKPNQQITSPEGA